MGFVIHSGRLGKAEEFSLSRMESIFNNTAIAIEYLSTPKNGTEISNVIVASGGDYHFSFSSIIQNSKKGGSINCYPQVNGAFIFKSIFRYEPDQAKNTLACSMVDKPIKLKKGENTISFYFYNVDKGTATVHELTVKIKKVNI